MTPVMKFETDAQINECLHYWVKTLFLQDWIIKVKMCEPDDFKLPDCTGENEYQMVNKCCVIRILKPEYYGDRILKYCAEATLVHELLHLKYNWVEQNYNSIESVYYDTLEHQLIEQMAKSLIMTKYDLSFDWFKNF